MKRAKFHGAAVVLVMLGLGSGPASAQMAVREKTCTATVGTNMMTYDCGFNVKNYVAGTPLTVALNFTCTGSCGPVMSFGLGEKTLTPPAALGRLVGGRRSSDGLALTFVFDTMEPANGIVTNAHFTMNVLMDDGTGGSAATPCPVEVHLVR